MESADFVGLSKKAVYDLTERMNLIPQIIEKDGKSYLPIPSDIRDDRVLLWFEKGKVIKAHLK